LALVMAYTHRDAIFAALKCPNRCRRRSNKRENKNKKDSYTHGRVSHRRKRRSWKDRNNRLDLFFMTGVMFLLVKSLAPFLWLPGLETALISCIVAGLRHSYQYGALREWYKLYAGYLSEPTDEEILDSRVRYLCTYAALMVLSRCIFSVNTSAIVAAVLTKLIYRIPHQWWRMLHILLWVLPMAGAAVLLVEGSEESRQ